MPILGDAGHKAMVDFMLQLPSRLRKPDAILVINAHWEESMATLSGARNPSLFYDYYGFPDKAYEITDPAPRNPELAKRIADILNNSNVPGRSPNPSEINAWLNGKMPPLLGTAIRGKSVCYRSICAWAYQTIRLKKYLTTTSWVNVRLGFYGERRIEIRPSEPSAPNFKRMIPY